MISRLRHVAMAIAVASSFSVGATPAMAQHVVTEDEAAKLTLEALTAPPPRPVYRPVIRTSYRYFAHVRGRHAFARVAYHPARESHRRHHR